MVNRNQNDERLHYIFERMIEMLQYVNDKKRLSVSPNEKSIVDMMIKKRYIRQHIIGGKDYYHITKIGEQLLTQTGEQI